MFLVSLLVFLSWHPDSSSCSLARSFHGASVVVPETTVNKYNFASRNKDEVWSSWKVLAMAYVTIAQGVSCGSDAHSRFSAIVPSRSCHVTVRKENFAIVVDYSR